MSKQDILSSPGLSSPDRAKQEKAFVENARKNHRLANGVLARAMQRVDQIEAKDTDAMKLLEMLQRDLDILDEYLHWAYGATVLPFNTSSGAQRKESARVASTFFPVQL